MTSILDAGRLLAGARAKRARVFERLGFDRANGCAAQDVRNVLVIAAASRSGSSFLHRALSGHPSVVSLNGETSVFERLHGVGLPVSDADSDFVPSDRKGLPLSLIADDILRDAGVLYQGGSTGLPSRELVADGVQRLLLQHPELDLDPEALGRACADALARVPWDPAEGPLRWWAEVIRRAAAEGVALRAEDYDTPGASRDSADQPPPFSGFALEEPPFVVPRPRAMPSPAGMAEATLLLKASSDCYRMGLLRRLFPNARYRFVLLARNPAGAINGLLDGWASGGFYSHPVGGLAIEGYSLAERPWTRRWWKFDLPPGWAERRRARLEDVCAWQWSSANAHLLRAVKDGVIEERLEVRYERLLDPASRHAELERILAFAGLDPRPARSLSDDSPVMAVRPPAAGKWRARAASLRGVLESYAVNEVAGALGYDVAERERWP